MAADSDLVPLVPVFRTPSEFVDPPVMLSWATDINMLTSIEEPLATGLGLESLRASVLRVRRNRCAAARAASRPYTKRKHSRIIPDRNVSPRSPSPSSSGWTSSTASSPTPPTSVRTPTPAPFAVPQEAPIEKPSGASGRPKSGGYNLFTEMQVSEEQYEELRVSRESSAYGRQRHRTF